MVRDAELHADEDKAEREKIETRNQADNLIYSTEKSLKDYGDKISEEDKSAIEQATAALRTALEGNDVEDIKAKMEALQQAAYKLAEEVYKQAAPEGSDQGGSSADASGQSGSSSDDNVEDADFEVVDDDK